MANNQYVNKVVFGNGAVLDLTQDTVDASHLVRGYTAHSMTGQIITGVLDVPTITLTVASLPTKTTYPLTQPLDLTGLEVIATTSDGYTKNVTNSCVYSPANGTPVTDEMTGVTVTYTYLGTTYTTSFPITVLTIATWANGTDAQIVNMLNAHYAGEIDITEYWSVGDVRKINLSAVDGLYSGEVHSAKTNFNLVLMNAGGKELTTPINGITECAFVLGSSDSLGWSPDNGMMNSTNTNEGGWDSCPRRTWLNEVFPNAFSDTLRSIFKQHKNITGIGSNQDDIIVSNDLFTLPSGKEVWGTDVTNRICNTEFSATNQFTYFESAPNRRKQVYCWSRSPRNGNSTQFICSDGAGNCGQYGATEKCSFAPISVI